MLNKFDKDYKHFKKPYKTALLYLKKSVFLLSILNILDWINEPTKPSWLNIKTLNYEAGKDLDKIRNYILKKWSDR